MFTQAFACRAVVVVNEHITDELLPVVQKALSNVLVFSFPPCEQGHVFQGIVAVGGLERLNDLSRPDRVMAELHAVHLQVIQRKIADVPQL